MPYKPTRVHCNVCGTWIVETDARGAVTKVNKKVIKRTSGTTAATNTDDGIELGVDLFLFPGAAHIETTRYVCSCRGGSFQATSVIPAQPTDTL